MAVTIKSFSFIFLSVMLDSSPSQGPPGLPGIKGDSGFKGEKARRYYDANLKLLYCVFLISAYAPYLSFPK